VSSDRILTLNDDTFDEQVTKLEGPILVDFWASWCRPCLVVAPWLDELAEELDGRAHVAKIDIDENGDLVNRFGIRSVPTLVVFKGGKVVDQMVGAAPKDQIRRMLLNHIG
jgi:thioredoxin 1